MKIKFEINMKKARGILYWAPRILSILFIFYLTLFSLDVFQPGMSAKQIALGLLMHNVPSIIMIILLVIAWKKEIVGVATYFGVGLLYIGYVTFGVVNSKLQWYLAITWIMAIAGPALIIGTLFLINWKIKQRKSP